MLTVQAWENNLTGIPITNQRQKQNNITCNKLLQDYFFDRQVLLSTSLGPLVRGKHLFVLTPPEKIKRPKQFVLCKLQLACLHFR